MRLIHTSDWHFGQTLRGHERNAEHEYFITQLTEYIQRYNPDALLVSGDLYDNSTSTAEVDNFFRTQILRIRRAAPQMQIIMIAGNHDGYAKQEADSKLWELGDIVVVGHIAMSTDAVDYDRHIIHIPQKGYILPIPFTRFYPPMPADDDIKMRKRYFYDRLLARVAERNTDNMPVIMMGHLNYEGAEIAEQESLVRGGEEPTLAEELSSGYDYLAMGHIHYPQTHGRARYCGSPIPMNFSEAYPHSVTLVDIENHGDMPQLTELPIEPLFGIKKISQQPSQSLNDFMQYAKEHIGDTKCYIRFAILNDDNEPVTDKEQIIAQTVSEMPDWIYCGYDLIGTQTATGNNETPIFTPQQLENNNPLELAKLYYKEQKGGELSDELLQLLQEAVDAVENQNANM